MGRDPGQARFPRSARLTNARQFKRVFQRATKSADQYFVVLAAPNRDHQPRLGLAISVKAAGTVVNRNRLKRVVRESFRINQHRLGGLDIVVLARSGAREAPNAMLHTALSRHWTRLLDRCARS